MFTVYSTVPVKFLGVVEVAPLHLAKVPYPLPTLVGVDHSLASESVHFHIIKVICRYLFITKNLNTNQYKILRFPATVIFNVTSASNKEEND